MIDYIAYAQVIHGAYNTAVILLFFYQSYLGFKIRRERKAGDNRDFTAVRKHRRQGPVLAVLAALGFMAGLTIVLIDEGRIAEHPLHFVNGLLIIVLIVAAYTVSQRIAVGPDYRTLHMSLGLTILCLFVLQAFLGLSILL